MGIYETLDEWSMWERSAGRAERTIAERRAVVLKLCDWAGTTPETFTTRDAVRFTGRAGLTASSRATYQASLRAFTRWAVAIGVREDDPMESAPRARRPKSTPRPVESGELGRILAATTRRKTRMMVLLASLAGLRVHEVAKVRGDDVDREAGSITVTGKGGKTAIIPLHPAIAEHAAGFPVRGYWFPSTDAPDVPVTARGVGAAIQRSITRAGVQATPHQLRHWYGTHLVESGADLRTVQELMRHESLQSTQIYTAVTSQRRTAAISRLALPEAA